MATHFLDTSAVVKYYHTERGSDWVRALFDAQDQQGLYLHQLLLAEISIAEAAAAFAILARTQQIEIEFRDAIYQRFIRDLVARFQTIALTRSTIETAAALTQRYPLKGYDAIQLATALDLYKELQQVKGDLIFVTSDNQLIRAAQAEGLQVENPIQHDSQ